MSVLHQLWRMVRILLAVALVSGGLLYAAVSPALATSQTQPNYGPGIVVDGSNADWNLAVDFFANMYRAGDASKQLESKAYLRYNCDTQVMYVMVLAQPGVQIIANLSPAETYVKIDGSVVVNSGSGNNGTPPDFAWIGLSGGYAQGWEASFPLATGSYQIDIHTQVNDGGPQTSAFNGRSLPVDPLCVDYGDLSSDYHMTLLADNGASHTIGALRIGERIDGETDGQPDTSALGDDLNNVNDEDGVQRAQGETWTPGTTVHISVTVNGGTGYLVGWFDWDGECSVTPPLGDCDFTDPLEVQSFGSLTPGVHVLPVTIPAGYTTGDPVNVRLRLFSTDPGPNPSPTGTAISGEVEDFHWTFSSTAVQLSSFTASANPGEQSGLALLGLAALLGLSGLALLKRRLQTSQ